MGAEFQFRKVEESGSGMLVMVAQPYECANALKCTLKSDENGKICTLGLFDGGV